MNKVQFRKVFKVIRMIWVMAGIIFIVWNFISFLAKGIDAAMLTSNAEVAIVNGDKLDSFAPLVEQANGPKQTGFIFYPGAMVDPNAYFPLLKAIAANGYPVRLIHLPYRLAFLPTQVDELFATTLATIEQESTIAWVIGGHSKGGALAARFTHTHSQAVAGLALLATTHPKAADTDLSAFTKPTLKIYATNDGIASVAEIEQFSHLLPATTEFVSIAGGNHAHFGYYGEQLGDESATISRQQQQQETLDALLTFLNSIETGTLAHAR